MATVGRSAGGNNSAAWGLAQKLQAEGMSPDMAMQRVDQMLSMEATAQLAIRGASNPQPGQSFDALVDRSTIFIQIDEVDPNGTSRRIQEIRLNNLVRLQSKGDAT